MRRDSEVEQQVLRSLQLDSAISSREICVESRDGFVTVSGTVASYHESSAVYFATRRAPGVRGVTKRIEVKDGSLLIPEHPSSAVRSAHSMTAPTSRRPTLDDRRLTCSSDGKSKANGTERRAK